MKEQIAKRVHELYWKENINCARTTLVCLSELFEIAIEPQTIGLQLACMVQVDIEHNAA